MEQTTNLKRTDLGFATDSPDNVFVMLKIRSDRAVKVAETILKAYDKDGRPRKDSVLWHNAKVPKP